MGRIRVMILGPGWVAGEHIKGYCRDPRAEIVAVVGFRPEDAAQCEKYRRQHGFPGPYYDDLGKALAESGAQVASVCTINHMHYANALAAVEAGLHVFCEKPLALTAEQVDALVAAAARRKVVTHVGHVVRWYSAVAELKRKADAGLFGAFYYGEADYFHQYLGEWKTKAATGGSSWLMGGIHALDLLLHFMGYDSPVAEVYGVWQPAQWRKDFDYETSSCAILRFADGRIGKVATDAESAVPYTFRLHLHGTKGGIHQALYHTPDLPPRQWAKQEGQYPDDWQVAEHPFPAEVSYFLDCVESGGDSDLSFARAAKAYHLVFAIEESARTGKPVRVTRN
ncbi:MAG TPA: Gfo/Idh/MocA family oxidoreductase [Planctomycetota bacterium]|nr:Gfo/Idh/MocA family oxidoreductase [Planctomycetota bacterium]